MSPSPAGSRPRVLQVITRVGLGGAEAVAASIIHALAHEFEFGVLAVRGVETSPIGASLQRDLAAQEVPIFSGPNVSQKCGGLAFAGWRAAQVFRRFQPDIVHLHTEIPEAAGAVGIFLTPGAPRFRIVRTIHNSVYWHFWPRLGRWCERRLPAPHVAAVSQDALAAFAARRASAGVGPPASPPVVIYNGVPAATFAPATARTATRPWRVLFAGRFEPEKGTDLLPEILRRVRPPAPGAELTLHGQGQYEGVLRTLAARPPEGWTVRVEPPIAGLAARMKEFDLLLMPSRFEGLGLVAIEATLAGLTVVATRAPGLREALPADHPWRGEPCDAASFAVALQQAFDQRDRWPDAVARAQTFARERFDPVKMADGYRRLYRQALDSRR